MGAIKIKGSTSGSTTITAPATGSDETVELFTALAAKAPLASPTFTGTPALPDGTTLAGSLLTRGVVLQVQVGTTSTSSSTTSSTYVDTNLSATITPTKDTSSVLVIVFQNGIGKSTTTTNARTGFKLFRGATELLGQQTVNWLETNVPEAGRNWSVAYLDTPATTSSLTYKTQYNNINNSGTVLVQGGSNRSAMILVEIAA